MNFAYDDNKSFSNKEKHGIGFDEVRFLWFVPHVQLEAKTKDEPRFMIIGKINQKFYSCIYTTRGNDTIRLISARRSRKTEERIYHENIKE